MKTINDGMPDAAALRPVQHASVLNGIRCVVFWLLLLGVLLLVGCGVPATDAAAQLTPAPVVPGPIMLDAHVLPEQQSDLRFDMGGTVAEILVKEGDSVQAGMPLARLDARDLELAVARARAARDEAQAAYEQIRAGATDEAIAAARARRDQALALLQQVQSGVSPEDLAAARAQIRQAQEHLARVRRGADPEPIAAIQAQVQQAQANLQAQRDGLSAAKTHAALSLQQAAQALTQAQAEYAQAQSNWVYVQETGNDPLNPTSTNPLTGQKSDNKLSDQARAAYYTRFVQAEAALRQAETALQQAQLAYDSARQQEASGVQAAEAQLAYAQANLENLLATADPELLAAAEAQLAQARAALARLVGEQRAAEIAAAEAGLQVAQAALDQARAPTREVDLNVARTRIQTAEVALQQAERQLDKATLRAPFDGIVGEMNLDPGEVVAGPAGPTAVVLADPRAWRINSSDVTERDVVRLREGMPVTISFEALPDLHLSGVIDAIKPLGVNQFGDINYTITVRPNTWDARLRWQMSATITIAP